MTRRSPRTVLGALGAVTVLGAGLLTACGSDDDAPADVVDVRWQVTAVGDDGYGAPAQARTWLVVGGDTFTGAVGCVRLSGDVDWSGSGDSATVTFSDIDREDGDADSGDCLTGDTYNADQITEVLGNPALRWTYDDSNTLRNFRVWVDGTPEHGISFSG